MIEQLIAARREWFDAYVGGDVVRLARLEDEGFVVIGPNGIEAREERLAAIAAAAATGRWIPAGSHAKDDRVDFQCVSPDVVTAYGVGRIVTPRGGADPVVFTEVWKRTDEAGWKVLHLHYHAHPSKAASAATTPSPLAA